MPQIKLKAGASRVVPTSGIYLSIVNSTGSFSIESPRFGAVVGEVGRQYDLQAISQVTFVNDSVIDLNIEYEVANIRITTSGKGVVAISNLPATQQVSLAANQSLSVGNFPAVQPVSFAAGLAVDIGNFPASFSVSNLPAVQAVTIEAGQEISIKTPTGYNPLAPADFSAGDVVIAQKSGRDTLIIMADEENTLKIWVGGVGIGIPLIPGQTFNLGSDAAVTLHAENPADKCYLAEVIK